MELVYEYQLHFRHHRQRFHPVNHTGAARVYMVQKKSRNLYRLR